MADAAAATNAMPPPPPVATAAVAAATDGSGGELARQGVRSAGAVTSRSSDELLQGLARYLVELGAEGTGMQLLLGWSARWVRAE